MELDSPWRNERMSAFALVAISHVKNASNHCNYLRPKMFPIYFMQFNYIYIIEIGMVLCSNDENAHQTSFFILCSAQPDKHHIFAFQTILHNKIKRDKTDCIMKSCPTPDFIE